MNKFTIVVIGIIVIIIAWVIRAKMAEENILEPQIVEKILPEAQKDDIDKAVAVKRQKNLAPDFTLKSLDGELISLSDYRGKKAVLLDFWASWCPNCRRNMPNEQKLYEEFKDEVEVLGVNIQETESVARSFIEANGITFPILLDSKSDVSTLYGVNYTNFHVLISKSGQLIRLVPGDVTREHFRELTLVD